jgi:pre-rRNA-processing protein IPI3
LKVVADGSLLVSAGKDARCLVWNVLDLIEIRANEDGNDKVVKPLHVFADHSLEISDIFINNSIHQDLKLYTSSKDSTIRVYSLFDFQLLTTFVLNNPVESIVVDSADRVIFAGLSNGNIRQINLYEANKATNVLESKGGYGKIITVTEDQNLTETITYHNGNPVTKLSLSLDASLIISGDSLGKIVACDVVSKQVVKELKETNGGKITNIEIFSTTLKVDNTAQVEKNNRPVPQLKRELNQGSDQDVLYQIPFKVENDLFNVDEYLDRVATESLIFENLTNVDSHVVISGSNGTDKDSKIKELETKISKLTGAYKDLRGMYDELYEEHNSK